MSYSWIQVNSDSAYHPNAVLAGHDVDGAQIYVGRTYHEGDILPAKVIPSKNVAYVSHGGNEISKHQFEILCGNNFEWIASANGHVPDGALCAGNQSNGEPLFIGRANYEGSLTPGKIHQSHNCLYIPFGGAERSLTEYEVLVEKLKKPCDWVQSFSHQGLPGGAILAGHDVDQTPIYVGRAFHEGDQLPAKVVPSHGVAYVPYGGQEHRKNQFEVLCNGHVSWIPAAYGHIPPNAVIGGRTSSGEPLYIGRASYNGSLTPGKIQPSHNTLYIPFGGSEIGITDYEVLVE